ncbi:MAG: hypothetical protein AAF791_02885 [Bacteroidota bacterium]
MVRVDATVVGGSAKGSDVRVNIGTVADFAGAATGAVVIPRGATLRFFREGTPEPVATMTLKLPARVGDAFLFGRTDENIRIGDTTSYFVWDETEENVPVVADTGRSVWATGENPDRRDHAFSISPVALDGTRVQGAATFTLAGHLIETAPAQFSNVYGDLRIAMVYGDNQVPRSVSATVALPSGSFNPFVGSLPATGNESFGLGDGPTKVSRTRLLAYGASGTLHDTFQGGDTAWRRQAWGTDTPGSNAAIPEAGSIDELAAMTALALVNGHLSGSSGERRVSATVQMGQVAGVAVDPIWPDRPVRLAHASRLASYADAGSQEIRVTVPPTPGSFVLLNPGTATEEVAQASAVALGVGGYTVTLAAPLAHDHVPGEDAWVGVLVQPSSLVWDLLADTATIEGPAAVLAPGNRHITLIETSA